MKRFKVLFAAVCMGALLFSNVKTESLKVENNVRKADDTSSTDQEKKEASKYLGYGFDVTSSKSILDPNNSVKLKAPILDVNSSNLQDKIQMFKTSNSTAINYVSKSKKNISESIGKVYSGSLGVGGSLDNIGPISSVKADLNVAFDRSSTSSWSTTMKEEYSVYEMVVKNRTVALPLDEKQGELTPYLSSSFLKDIGNITSLSKAKDVLDKYGTHLLMGYTLGGVLEMTNYFASKSSTYVKQVSDSFKVQVDAAISASKVDASASVGGSFSDSYTKMDNTDESTNSYRCTTYGGEAFTSLSIEQVFSYYSNAIDSGYLYNVWTRSINKGTDLTIVEVPESTPMVPLYQVLPLDSKYDKARAYLVEEYLMICKDVLSDYRNKNKEIVVNDLKEAENAAKGKVNVKGFNSIAMGDTDNFNEYTEVTKNTLNLKTGSVVSLDFNYEDFDENMIEWKAVTGSGSAATGVTFLDKKSGIFKLDYNSGDAFQLDAYVDGKKVATYNCKVFSKASTLFNYGVGTVSDPFLIQNENQFKSIIIADYLWNKYFKLTKDLNLGTIKPIAGLINQSFSGSIDGDFHTISYTLNLADNGLRNVGLIGTLSGTIKNLNIKKAVIKRSPTDDNNKSQPDKYGILKNSVEMKYNSVGLLAGTLNGGKVENVGVTNSEIDLDYGKCYISEGSDKGDQTNTTNVGGLIGLVNKGSVSLCRVNDNNIHVFSQKINNINVGGVIGHTTDGSLCGITTKSNTLNLESGKKDCGCGNSDNSFIYIKTSCFFGGLIGYVESVSKIDSALVNQKEIQFNSVLRSGTGSNCDFFVGGIYGRIKSLENVKYNAVNLTSFKFSPGNDNHQTIYKVGNFSGKADDISDDTVNSKCLFSNGGYDPAHTKQATDDGDSSFDKLGHKIVSQNDFVNSQYKDSFNFSNYDINLDSYDGSLSYFDITEAKRVFIKGESFSLGNVVLNLKKKYADEPETSNRFSVDSSAFKSDIPGTYTIKLSYGDIKDSYTVEVKEASFVKLDIQTKPDKMSYFVGEAFDSTGLVLTATYQDGTAKTILPDDPNLIIEMNSDGGKMVNGQNLIKFKYNDGTDEKNTELIVTARERDIESISVENLPDKVDYHFGDEIKLDGLKIRVNYKQADVPSEVVEYSDKTKDSFGIYYPTFKKGENAIKVSYDDYIVTEFKVEVEYDDTVQKKMNEFVNVVDSISEQTSLEDKFNKIKEASALKDSLKNVSEDDEYVAADKKLQKEISDYDSLVNKINRDFTTSLESGTSLTIGNLTTEAFGIATVSITAILALLLLIL